MADRLAKLEKAYRQNPDFPFFARLADLYLKRGKAESALEICLQGCQDFPEYATGFLVLVRCYEASGAVEEARDALDQALRIDPVNPKGYERLSAIYSELGVPTLALKTLQQAAILDPFAEKLPSRVDELTYEVRLESTREQDNGEVDPYITPDLETADGEASRAGDNIPESVRDEAVGVELSFEDERDVLMRDGNFVSARHDSGQVVECEAGQGVLNDGASDFGVVSPEEDQPNEDEYSGSNESTPDLDDVRTKAEDDDLFVVDEEKIQDREEETAPDMRSAETRFVADPDEGFEKMDWNYAEAILDAAGADIHADGLPANSTAEKSGTQVPDLGDTLDISESKTSTGVIKEQQEPIDEASADLGQAKVESEEVEDDDERRNGRGGGLGTRGDDELLRLFQEIETQGSDEVDASIEVGGLIDMDMEEERQRITTPTLAEIYTIQGLTQKAIETYRELLDQDPQNDFIRRKLEELESSGSKK